MNSLTERLPAQRSISKTTLSQRLFSLCYLIAIIIATFGWLSAFAWLTVKVTKWLLA
jgi:hypothetical protein